MTNIKTSSTQIKYCKISHILLLFSHILCHVDIKFNYLLHKVNCLIIKINCTNLMLKFNEKLSNSKHNKVKSKSCKIDRIGIFYLAICMIVLNNK